VLSSTGSGVSTNPATSIVVNPPIEAQVFTGTRVINFRTPNAPREKK
jgi:hypothetical protein